MPVIPTIQEAKEGGSLGASSSGPVWATEQDLDRRRGRRKGRGKKS
jgi:hypothetical protein